MGGGFNQRDSTQPMKLKLATNIVEHAASGLRMPEPVARRIEELSKGLPSDFTYRRIAKSPAKFRLDDGERTDVSLITTSDVDRDGDCVLPGGGDWSAYNKVVTFAHRYDELPVGSNWWMRPEGNGLAAKTHYPTKPADWEGPWLPSAVLHLMQQPIPTCTGKSIGFLPINIRGATPDEKSRRPELDGVAIVDKWAGIEYAVAPVPCNPKAEMEAVSKGMKAGVFDVKTADLFAAEFAHLMNRPGEQGEIVKAAEGMSFTDLRTLISDLHALKEPVDAVLTRLRGRSALPVKSLTDMQSMNTSTLPEPPKAMSTDDNAAGGAVAPPDDDADKPMCPKCLTKENVIACHGDAARYYQCQKCGERMKDDDGDGEMVDGMDPLPPETKVAPIPTKDPSVACPVCREEATKDADQDVSGLGTCSAYSCPKCGMSFLVPPANHRAPELNGTTDGTAAPNADGSYASNLDGTKSAASGGKALNAATESRALGLAKEGKCSDGPWEAPNGGDRKEEDCLGKREGKDVTPAEKWTDPIIQGGTLYRRAVADVESRESGNPIGEAAGRIMAALKAKDAPAKSVTPFVRPETIAAAIVRKRQQQMASFARLVGPAAVEAVEKRLGRV